jgi:hypothetical protein
MTNVEEMPLEYFEEEALAATQKDRARRQRWMEARRLRDMQTAMELQAELNEEEG